MNTTSIPLLPELPPPEDLAAIALRLLSLPTAPFREERVRAEILDQLSALKHVSVRRDRFGNLLAKFQRGDLPSRWMMSAHMDHPAFVDGVFQGGVPQRVLDTRHPTVSWDDFAVWDLPAPECGDGLIRATACDDLIGCAAMLATFVVLEKSDVEATLLAAFTSAEEVGLLGAAFLAKSGWIPPQVAALSLETSAESGVCPMHGGVVVRVGDKTSVFDSARTARLWTLAQDYKIKSQRGLMSGGTCEATAYQLFGVSAAALCIPLGNYHNCTPSGTIDREFVSISDFESLVKLCVAVAVDQSAFCPFDTVRQRIETKLTAALNQPLGG